MPDLVCRSFSWSIPLIKIVFQISSLLIISRFGLIWWLSSPMTMTEFGWHLQTPAICKWFELFSCSVNQRYFAELNSETSAIYWHLVCWNMVRNYFDSFGQRDFSSAFLHSLFCFSSTLHTRNCVGKYSWLLGSVVMRLCKGIIWMGLLRGPLS